MGVFLSPQEFHDAVSKHELVVVIFSDRDMSHLLTKAKNIAVVDTLCAQLDPIKHPEMLAMFGMEQRHPALLIMREQVVLYADACEPGLDTLETLLERIQALDMNMVRNDIEAQRAAEALELRGVCLSARRRTAHN